jgi:hypothetical protein
MPDLYETMAAWQTADDVLKHQHESLRILATQEHERILIAYNSFTHKVIYFEALALNYFFDRFLDRL